jgi:hypothetical protein
MDTLIEFAAKIGLALVVIWFFARIPFVMYWLVQPFLAGFIAGVLVTIIFVVRFRRS